MEPKNLEKKYKRALISGLFLFGIGIVLILAGIIIGEYYTYGGLDEWGGMVLGGFSILSFPFFFFGGWYLVDSIRIKKRIYKVYTSKLKKGGN